MSFQPRESLLRSGGFTLAATAWNVMVGLVTVPIMVTGLGAGGYGLYSVCFSIAALGSYLDFGLGWTSTKFIAEAHATGSRTHVSTVLTASALYHLLVAGVFAAALVSAAPAIARVVLRTSPAQASDAVAVLRLTACSFLASSLTGVFVNSLRGLGQFSTATIIGTGSLTVAVAGAALMAASGLGVVAAAGAQLTGAVAGALAGLLACREFVSATAVAPLVARLKAMLAFSTWNFGSRLVQMLVFQADKILLARWAGAAAVTFYAVPFGFAQRVSMLAGPAVTTIYPVAAAGHALGHDVRHDAGRAAFLHQYLLASRLLHIATAAIALAVLAWGDRFLLGWVGAEMAERGTLPLRVLTVGFWAMSVGSFDGSCVEGWNRPRQTFFMALAALAAGGAFGGVARWAGQPAPHAIAIGIAGYFVIGGAGQMVLWYRLSQYSLPFMLQRAAGPIAEMAAIAGIVTMVLRPLVERPAAAIGTLMILAVVLGVYGIARSLSAGERGALVNRLVLAVRPA